MKKTFSILFCLLACNASLLAQKTAKYSNEFMNLGAGARSFGMANSVLATTNNVNSGYWNPAGLTGLDANIELSFMHSEYFAGIANYDYLGFAAKLDDKSSFGITALRFGVDGILNTMNLIQNGQINYDQVSEFSAVDYGFLVSYARKQKLRKHHEVNFSYGGSVKIIHRKVGEFAKAWGFGVDVGAKYHIGETGWDFGITVKDITSTFNSWAYDFTEKEEQILLETGNYIPAKSLEITLPRILFGAAKSFEWDKIGLTAEMDLDITTDGKRNTLVKTNLLSIDPHLGVEGSYSFSGGKNKVFLRAGLGNLQKESNDDGDIVATVQPTIGAGLKLGPAVIDYAFTDVGNASAALYSHVFSINFSIYKQD